MKRWLVAALVMCSCRGGEHAAPGTGSGSAVAAVDPWGGAPKPLPPPKVTHPFPHPFVWKATRDGKTTYLFGTLHGGFDAEARIPMWVWKHFDDATTLVEETSLQDPEILRWTIRPEGSTLHAELGDEYWAKLERVVTPQAAYFLDAQSTAVAALRASGYGGTVRDRNAGAMDGELLVRAQGLGKKLVFLETAKFQSEMFTELFDLAVLKQLLDHGEELKRLNPTFLDAYLEGDADRFLEIGRQQLTLTAATDERASHLLDRLLVARNTMWVPKIEEVHAAGGAFVAVGALHLLGPGSVIEQLRVRGFTVERATE